MHVSVIEITVPPDRALTRCEHRRLDVGVPSVCFGQQRLSRDAEARYKSGGLEAPRYCQFSLRRYPVRRW